MSEDRDPESVVTASADGLSVEKRFEREKFSVPAVEFTLRSEREEPATVRLVDHVPEEFPMDSVGFHPEYDNDNWTAFKDHRVEYERELVPGEEVVTVYGVRLSETDVAADFMGEPELTDVESEPESPPDPLASVAGEPEASMDANSITDIVSEEGNQVVRDVLAGERETLPGLGAESGGGGVGDPTEAMGQEPAEADEPGTVEAGADPLADLGGADDAADEPTVAADPLSDPVAESVAEAEVTAEAEPVAEATPPAEDPADDADPAADAEPAVEPTEVEVDPPGTEDEPDEIVTAEPDLPATGVASALADEIREGAVSESDLAVLRQELDVALPESTNVRLRHLQSRVEDLTAYTEALEEFIDENGTAPQVIEEFEAQVAQLDNEMDDLESEVDDVRDLEGELAAVEDLGDAVEDLRSDRSATDERVDALEAEIESVSEEFDATRDQLREVRADLDDVAELETEIESVRAELDGIEDLEDRLDDVADLRTDVAAAREEVAELEELVGANTDDLSAIDETLSNVEAELAGVTDVEGDLQSLDEQVADLADRVETTEQSLESTVSDLQADVETIHDDIEEIRTWRDQLKGVFGAGE